MRLLDLFCGAGGAAVGYHRAGFTDITGVDIRPMPRYPFRFVQADALDFLASVQPGDFDLIHASPPCQGYSRMRHLPWLKDRPYPLLIEPVRAQLQRIGGAWVIENVADAPLGGVILCGMMFGLKVYRHRRFESSELFMAPSHMQHREIIGRGRYLNDRARPSASGMVSLVAKGLKVDRRARTYKAGLPAFPDLDYRSGESTARQVAGGAMGIDWMTREELSQAIPPAYTHFLG